MIKTRLFPSLFLVAVLLGACAPASTSTNPPAVATQPPVDSPTEASAPTPLSVATSRGPDLHATDPATVSLASGQIQFVEFFRFT